MDVFLKLSAQGQTIFMFTHNPDNAAFAHRVINIKDGSLVDDSGLRYQVG
jgi:putative ABC transport system ATP-binding protein